MSLRFYHAMEKGTLAAPWLLAVTALLLIGIAFSLVFSTRTLAKPEAKPNQQQSQAVLPTMAASKQGPRLGVAIQPVSAMLAQANKSTAGAQVVTVIPNSPAAKAGVKVDDIITKVDDQSLASAPEKLPTIISSYSTGDTISLTVFRDDTTVVLKAILIDTATK